MASLGVWDLRGAEVIKVEDRRVLTLNFTVQKCALLHNRNRPTDIENKLMAIKGERQGEG